MATKTGTKPKHTPDVTATVASEGSRTRRKTQDSSCCSCSCLARKVIAPLAVIGTAAYVWRDWIAAKLPPAAAVQLAALKEQLPSQEVCLETIGNVTAAIGEHCKAAVSDIKSGTVSNNSAAMVITTLALAATVGCVLKRCLCGTLPKVKQH